jgi:HK97 family phage major capsid protein
MKFTLAEIEKRMAEIGTEIETNDAADLEALDTEIAELRAEKESHEKREKLLNDVKTNKAATRKIDGPAEVDEKKNAAEERGKTLKEKRAITVGNSQIVLPAFTSTDIKPTFNEVSTLFDAVGKKVFVGGESFEQSYVDGYGEGDYTDISSDSDYNDVETVTKFASVTKSKITAYSEDPEEVLKLANADYDGEITKGISIAIKKKLSKQILTGPGTAGTFVGIFSALATAIDDTKDIPITAIDENTLDNIVYKYGGDEDVQNDAALILNKLDLYEFAKVRGTENKQKVYKIVNNGNSGTIDGIPFILNSACKSLAAETTSEGDYCMAYGSVSNYLVAVFSDLEILRSIDYKFKQGQIAHRGSIFAGGNVVAKNGFVRVTKGGTPSA